MSGSDMSKISDDDTESKLSILLDIASRMGTEVPEEATPDAIASRVVASVDIEEGKYNRMDSISIAITGDMSEEEVKARVEELNDKLSYAGLKADDLIDFDKVMNNLEDGQSNVTVIARSNDNGDLIAFSNYDGEQNIAVPPVSIDDLSFDDLKEMHGVARTFEEQDMSGELDYSEPTTSSLVSIANTDYTASDGGRVVGFIASAMVEEIVKPEESTLAADEPSLNAEEVQPAVITSPVV